MDRVTVGERGGENKRGKNWDKEYNDVFQDKYCLGQDTHFDFLSLERVDEIAQQLLAVLRLVSMETRRPTGQHHV